MALEIENRDGLIILYFSAPPANGLNIELSGELLEKLDRLGDAREAYRLLLDKRLPFGEAVARTRLEQLGVPSPKP